MVGERDPSEKAREAEALICQIPGVLRARITLGVGGEVTEVHVVAWAIWRGKQRGLVRDVETIVKTTLEREFDFRCISVAILGEEEAAQLAAADGHRVRLCGVGLQLGEVAGSAVVELARQGLDSTGSASGAAVSGGWQRLVAAATLDAVTRFLPSGMNLSLGTIQRLHLGHHEVVLVGVEYVGPKETRELVGAAFMGPDSHRAVAQATLGAVNRILGKHLIEAEGVTILTPPF